MKIHYTTLLMMLSLAQGSLAQTTPSLYERLQQNYNSARYEECISMTKDVELYAQATKDTSVARTIFYVADAYNQIGEVDKAITWFEKEKALRATLGLMETPDFSGTLYNLAQLYLQAGQYQKAGAMADALLANDLKIYGATSYEYVLSVLSVADVYRELDRFPEAEKLLEATIRQQDKKSLNDAVLKSKLGDLYTVLNQFSKAGKALNESLTIIERTAGINSVEYLNATINLGILYFTQGKYPEAEEAFDFVLNKLDDGDPAYWNVLNNQALVYQYVGRIERSRETFERIKEADSVNLGPTHPDFAITLSNVGLVYADEHKYAAAERSLLRAMQIQRDNGEDKTASYARKMNNLAKIYRLAGQPEKAIPLLESSMAIFKKTLGANSPEVATAAFNLGIAYWQSGKNDNAITYLKSSANIRSVKLGKHHPKYAESMQKIAEFQWERKQLKEARQTFGAAFDNYYFQINAVFPVMTEDEKSKFFFTNIKPSFEKFNAFALRAQATEAGIMGDVYDHHINTKAAIMYATERVKESILKSSDTTLIRMFTQWEAKKEQIARLYSQNQPASRLDSLQQTAEKLEKEITKRSSVFARQISRKRASWQEIQKALKPGEAAVEIVRFRGYDPAKGGKFDDQILYAFLVVTKDVKAPEVLVLNNGAELEGRLLKYYKNTITFQIEDTRSYASYFESLSKHLKDKKINKVYLSRDGVYNQVNINTFRNPTTKQFLLDEFDITLVTNTRELLEKRVHQKSNSQSSLLIGFPKFNLHPDDPGLDTQRPVTRGGNLSRGLRGDLFRHMRGDGGIAVLPGTEIEIKEISRVTPNPEVFMTDMASEPLLKQVISPMILHVATHGYFLEDEPDLTGEKSYVPSPLLKSGLILAGAENFLKTGTPVNDEGDDGILTAYEAMNLNLDDTELVVLSACQTGLGVVKNGEGVYGLQRAFKMAGARSMIMSMWSVDDAATQKLMTLFYTENAKTNDPHKAFRIAQQKLKEEYPHPFYWGAFIMVGI